MLQEGDKYIHFTKYGGVNFGTVKRIWYAHMLDTDNSCMYLAPQVTNESGLTYDMFKDGRFYKIEKEYTLEEVAAIRGRLKRLAGMNKHERIQESLKGVKLPHEKADL